MYPNLKLELWRRGLRQNRLARMLGIDESLLSRIVNGYREPDAELRARIANALNSSEKWLFEVEATAASNEGHTIVVSVDEGPSPFRGGLPQK